MTLDQPDERVAAAAAHWGARFTANGTDYGDFVATLGRISRWDDWCREWGSTAAGYERLAESAEDAGHPETAAGAWRRAALAWHWGKFVFVDHPDEQREGHERAVACYRKAAGALVPPAELVHIPYGDTSLPAYLRVPHAQGAAPGTAPGTAGGRKPIVIMLPGLDSTKEELQSTAGYMLARGLATIAVDGPGQGESEYALPIEPAYERVATAAVDYLSKREDVDTGNIGAFGVSLGGYYAARAMAFENRLRAGVELAGPYRFDLGWDDLPPMTRETLRHRSRTGDDDAARAFAGRLNLEGAAPRITKPLLVVHGRQDRIVGPEHAEQLASEAPGAELVIFEDGNHGVTNHAFASRSLFADWMADHLGATSPSVART